MARILSDLSHFPLTPELQRRVSVIKRLKFKIFKVGENINTFNFTKYQSSSSHNAYTPFGRILTLLTLIFIYFWELAGPCQNIFQTLAEIQTTSVAASAPLITAPLTAVFATNNQILLITRPLSSGPHTTHMFQTGQSVIFSDYCLILPLHVFSSTHTL